MIDRTGRSLGWQSFPATAAGYQQLLDWTRTFGPLLRIGVEGTGCWGAGLTRHLLTQAVEVVEVLRPGRKDRRGNGKSDPIDADAAARAALSGRATSKPKTRDGRVEALRVLKVARDSAVNARSIALRQIRALIVTAPDPLRARLGELSRARLITTCAALAPQSLDDPAGALEYALGCLARRWQRLHTEATELDYQLARLVTAARPQLLQQPGIGVQTAAVLLISAGDNPQRLASEAAFAHHCGVAPLPASTGRVVRHRLNPGGDRHANSALHMIVVTRLRTDQRTREYLTRRTTEGLSKREIMRCLKRYVAREVHHLLTTPPDPAQQPA